MKFATSMSVTFVVALENVFVVTAPTADALVPVEPRAADDIHCGTCVLSGIYCDAGGS
ncbi:hypothetical protein L207DRAFT_583232 [Hyaloscypha variabilis F]|uniref:Uncharacterized protein n=1 Tax=Hyaloscypha variabilis (strain UAMH 11265 / GT02V1 / F) TaxID=1149755 RepID=A0A2J6RRC3_HYAVF|nr:hypothetical protein L207DRAFT_583232 [Hyaloscypha variabilis F]